ncbi:hypothetical protein KQI84_05380 [bacterium]|nr:hypothetical protein [bacterium]
MHAKTSGLGRFLATVIMMGALIVPLNAQDSGETADPCQEQLQKMELRLSIAQQEADLAKQRLADLKAELKAMGPRYEEAKYKAMVDRIAEQTAEIRDLELKTKIESNILDSDALSALLDKLLSEELTPEAVRGYEMTWGHLELIPRDADLRIVYQDLLEEQVGGLYNDKDKTLYVVDTFDPKSFLGRVLLSHEICHALQDQNYNFDDLPFRVENEDQMYATQAIIEGDATLLMTEWGKENFSPKDMLGLNAIMDQQTEQLEAVPPALTQMLLYPYLAGLKFLMQLQIDGMPNFRERVFEDVPQSTEQILHPEKYWPEKEPPIEVSLPEWEEHNGLKEIYRSPQGEWMTRLILALPDEFPTINLLSTNPLVHAEVPYEGAAGWGGDELVTVAGADDVRWFIAWRSVWDTDEDATEFSAALARRMGHWKRFRGMPEEFAKAPPTRGGAVLWPAMDNSGARVERDGKTVTLILGSNRTMIIEAGDWLGVNQ